MTSDREALSDRLECPDAEVCKTCPCAGEDDACFPGERLRAEVERLRRLLADVTEGETAEEGTPQWYALRNARAELSGSFDEQGQST